jgi:hypothetical protein
MPAQRPAYTSDLADEEWQILAPLLQGSDMSVHH